MMEDLGNRNSLGTDKPQYGLLYKFLRLFSDVYPGEGLTAFLLSLNTFLLFLAYYIMKPVRDALVLGSYSPEFKTYLNTVGAVTLVFVVKLFAVMAAKLPRHKLITWVTFFFISNLGIFYALHRLGVGAGLGIAFFVWVGIFSLVVVAQFWGFANDLYTEDQGKRLFPIIAFGATFGGFCGSSITGWLSEPWGPFGLMLASGAFLVMCIVITWIVHLREKNRAVSGDKIILEEKPSNEAQEAEKPIEKGGAFRLVFKNRYLLYIALFVLLLNFINTNGVYILDNVMDRAAVEAVETGAAGGMDKEDYLSILFADFYKYQNLFAMFLQLFLVSRIFKWFGVRVAIFFLPLIAIGGYVWISFGAYFLLVNWVKVFENGTDYSLMNTTRHSLFLITTREEKYKAQAVTKTFFHRAGDVLHGLLVLCGTTFLAFKLENYAMVNVVLAMIWIGVGVLIFKQHKALSAARQ
ncbi:MAG: NTP/NDP exchange transporter [Nitrospirota bacterium]